LAAGDVFVVFTDAGTAGAEEKGSFAFGDSIGADDAALEIAGVVDEFIVDGGDVAREFGDGEFNVLDFGVGFHGDDGALIWGQLGFSWGRSDGRSFEFRVSSFEFIKNRAAGEEKYSSKQ